MNPIGINWPEVEALWLAAAGTMFRPSAEDGDGVPDGTLHVDAHGARYVKRRMVTGLKPREEGVGVAVGAVWELVT